VLRARPRCCPSVAGQTPLLPGEMLAADASMLVNSVKNDDLRLFDPLA
jgi:hypothetical protein